ncbi:MAG: hypothetical protein EHM36_12955 [Deltaproteobacteria bacterium]|nr:MAG: hypothetical protein EHM36_12955 [Deltaproteobacteria bacterium]
MDIGWFRAGIVIVFFNAIVLGGLGILSGAISTAGAAPRQEPFYAGFGEIDLVKNHFLLVGDTQKTSAWEFWRERNEKERKRIIDEMARRNPAFIVHLGDLTARGSSRKHWEEFDDLNKELRDKRVPYFPILGNHEFYGDNGEALGHYFARLSHLQNRRWYSFTWKGVALILLDSNFANLSPEEIEEQENWYLTELERFEKDDRVDHVIVCCHEPPYTNSRAISPSEKSRRYFADPFVRFQKTSLFFSGHGHTYERFQMRDKFFIVTGGGGGPRHRIYIDPGKRRFEDLFSGPELRFFHFCEIEVHGTKLNYKVLRLEPDGTFTVVDPLRR